MPRNTIPNSVYDEKLNPRINENPYLENQLKQLEMQFNATKQRLQNKFGSKKFISKKQN